MLTWSCRWRKNRWERGTTLGEKGRERWTWNSKANDSCCLLKPLLKYISHLSLHSNKGRDYQKNSPRKITEQEMYGADRCENTLWMLLVEGVFYLPGYWSLSWCYVTNGWRKICINNLVTYWLYMILSECYWKSLAKLRLKICPRYPWRAT